MELKKNEKYDLENKRGLFFNIGLVTVLAVVFLAFEWRSYETGPMDLGPLNLDDIEEEIIPITQQNQPPPPPPPPPPQAVKATRLVASNNCFRYFME